MKIIQYMTVVLVVSALITCSIKNSYAGEVNYSLTLLGPSIHHVDNGETESQHNGIGMAATVDRTTAGLMRYTNSFGDTSYLLSLSRELYTRGDWGAGVGAGYVTGYGDNLTVPFMAWGSVRYKWIVVAHVPGQVTTLGASIPLGELF